MNDWRKYDAVFLDSMWQTEESLMDWPTPRAPWRNKLRQFLLDWFDPKVNFILQQSSGSTGRPKNIAIPKDKLINSALMTGRYFNLAKEENALLCLSTDYIGGKMMVIRAMVWGMNLICLEPSNHCLDKLQHLEDISFAAMVPSQLFHAHQNQKFSQIKRLIVGGAAVPQDLLGRIQHCQTEIFATYGMTETVSHIALRKLNGANASEKYTTLPGVKISRNENGCLKISAKHLSDTVVETRDLVEISSPQEFEYLGRLDSVINSGGVKLIPEQIEKKLQGIISEEFVLISRPDAVLGERMVLVLESEKSADEALKLEQSLLVNCREILGKFEIPKEVFFLSAFPRTKTHKIQRNKISQLLDNQQAK